MSPTAEYIFSAIMAATNIVLVVGVLAAFRQVKAAQGSLKAQVLMKLFDEWRSENVYRSLNYVNKLRASWKAFPLSEWDGLAETWVQEHAGRNFNSADPKEQALWDEWVMRRTASQFLAKMGTLIDSGYLSQDDFFGVDPEVGRQLAVLIPIELAVQKHWAGKEQNPIAKWDRPFPKWEFNRLWAGYQTWHDNIDHKYDLNPIDWSKVSSATKK